MNGQTDDKWAHLQKGAQARRRKSWSLCVTDPRAPGSQSPAHSSRSQPPSKRSPSVRQEAHLAEHRETDPDIKGNTSGASCALCSARAAITCPFCLANRPSNHEASSHPHTDHIVTINHSETPIVPSIYSYELSLTHRPPHSPTCLSNFPTIHMFKQLSTHSSRHTTGPSSGQSSVHLISRPSSQSTQQTYLPIYPSSLQSHSCSPTCHLLTHLIHSSICPAGHPPPSRPSDCDSSYTVTSHVTAGYILRSVRLDDFVTGWLRSYGAAVLG